MPYRKYLKYIIIGLIIALVSALMRSRQQGEEDIRDYDDIKREGILRVTTEYGNNTYHINEDGDIDGFHYQLIKLFAEKHGLQLEVIPETDPQKQDQLLHEGKCDLIASGCLLPSEYDTTLVRYTHPVTVDRLLLIQHKPDAEADTLCPYLHSQIGLAGKTVCIPENSPFEQRIRHMMEEIGDSIHIRKIPRYDSEQLMAMVAHGDICYAVCEEHVVRAHIHQYPQLDLSLPISFNQFYSWMTHAQSVNLLDSLNNFIKSHNQPNEYHPMGLHRLR